jgi:hypothetical protein
MTTQETANRLIELYNQGKALQAEEELYAESVVSYEQDESRNAVGKEAVMAKTKAAFEALEEVYHSAAEKVMINGNAFLIIFKLDAKPKGGERFSVTEYGFYKLENGKVAEEYFFM